MTQRSAIHHFQLEPDEIVGGRFRVTRWDTCDPDWPAMAVDLLHHQRQVQLAVQPVGPWLPDTPATELWDEPWPDPNPSRLLPLIYCPDLRLGGGVVSAIATPHYPSAFDGVLQRDSDAQQPSVVDAFHEEVFDTYSTLYRQLTRLRELHRVSHMIEALHQSKQAHGSLKQADFRRDEVGQILLRPTTDPVRQPQKTKHRQAHDRAALQQLVCEALPRSAIASLTGHLAADDAAQATRIRGRLRAVLHRRYRSANTAEGITQWRLSLYQLIREIEVALLTDDARQTRNGVIDSLMRGEMDQIIRDTASNPDPWCHEMQDLLAYRREQTHADYAHWLDEHRDLALHTSCEQFLALMHRGFGLPGPLPLAQMERRLTGSIHHLRAIATAIRNQSWQHAHDALSAAVSLDPANPVLTTLATITPAPGPPGIPGTPGNPGISTTTRRLYRGAR